MSPLVSAEYYKVVLQRCLWEDQKPPPPRPSREGVFCFQGYFSNRHEVVLSKFQSNRGGPPRDRYPGPHDLSEPGVTLSRNATSEVTSDSYAQQRRSGSRTLPRSSYATSTIDRPARYRWIASRRNSISKRGSLGDYTTSLIADVCVASRFCDGSLELR